MGRERTLYYSARVFRRPDNKSAREENVSSGGVGYTGKTNETFSFHLFIFLNSRPAQTIDGGVVGESFEKHNHVARVTCRALLSRLLRLPFPSGARMKKCVRVDGRPNGVGKKIREKLLSNTRN